MVEVDYPHGDSTWPDTQDVIERCWGHLPVEDLEDDPPERRPALPVAPSRQSRPVTGPFVPTSGSLLPELDHARNWSSWPAPCGARATTTTWPGTSPTGNRTGRCCATRGSCCGKRSGRRTSWHRPRREGPRRLLAGPPRDSPPPGTPPSTPRGGGGRTQPSAVRHHLGRPGRVPPCHDQSSALGGGELVVVDEYDGPVNARASAARAITAMGAADMALFANHGVFVTGGSIRAAHQRAVALEYRGRRAWQVAAMGAVANSPTRPFVLPRITTARASSASSRPWPDRELRPDPGLLDRAPR